MFILVGYFDLAGGKYEISGDGLTVYNPTFADRGQYQCKGTEGVRGETKKIDIDVDVVSKY